MASWAAAGGAALVVPAEPSGPPDAAALEGWPGEGLSLAFGWRVEQRVVVSVLDLAELSELAVALGERRHEALGERHLAPLAPPWGTVGGRHP